MPKKSRHHRINNPSDQKLENLKSKKEGESQEDKENEELQELKQQQVASGQQNTKKNKEYVFKSLREEILRRASWKNGVTVTGLTSFLSNHPDSNKMVEEIHSLEKEGMITITPVQMKNESSLYGGTWQTLIKTIIE
jgi:citrate lyase alpha subunit